MEIIVILQIIITVFSVFAIIVGYLKYVYRVKEKFIYITNCSILPVSLWKVVVKKYRVKTRGENDHAFRPVLILPREYKDYFKVKKKKKAILEFLKPDSEKLVATAEVFCVPEDAGKWKDLRHPAMSLVLRRYFGIERPLYSGTDPPEGWIQVEHDTNDGDLKLLHRQAEGSPSRMVWAVSTNYSFRYYNPENPEDSMISKEPEKGYYIEYCGLSLKVRKKSIFVVDIDIK